MNKQEYADYQATVAAFMEREGLANLTTGHLRCPECNVEWDEEKCPKCGGDRETFDEPFFSWQPCQCCGSSLGGNREHATGYNPTTKEIQEYTICEDCAYYAEYGRLDDRTMAEIKEREQ